jgi:chemotaxis protein methyltransferase CheR
VITPLLPTPLAQNLDEREFKLIRDLVAREVGIHLHDGKRALVQGRLLKRVRELGLESFGAYYERVVAAGGAIADADELVTLIDRITTNETSFFREADQFAFLEGVLLPDWRAKAAAGARSRRVRIWSAGCSTGEEPYSLAMLLMADLPREDGWSIELLATDVSSRVLRVARDAVYVESSVSTIPERLRARSLLRGHGARQGMVRIAPEVRAMVRFERLNLHRDAFPAAAAFDLVLCRNVLIYFDAKTKARIVTKLVGRVARDGLLFVGHAESVGSFDARLHALRPNVYAVRPEGSS